MTSYQRKNVKTLARRQQFLESRAARLGVKKGQGNFDLREATAINFAIECIAMCDSFGLLEKDYFANLKDAGVDHVSVKGASPWRK